MSSRWLGWLFLWRRLTCFWEAALKSRKHQQNQQAHHSFSLFLHLFRFFRINQSFWFRFSVQRSKRGWSFFFFFQLILFVGFFNQRKRQILESWERSWSLKVCFGRYIQIINLMEHSHVFFTCFGQRVDRSFSDLCVTAGACKKNRVLARVKLAEYLFWEGIVMRCGVKNVNSLKKLCESWNYERLEGMKIKNRQIWKKKTNEGPPRNMIIFVVSFGGIELATSILCPFC